uniref:Probable 3-hydroxyacyl-CoA dehydrogenase F54C8.1 n=2 Tax=Nicotiana TaxID=4085 RepID=A0A1S4C0A9_TOBAC
MANITSIGVIGAGQMGSGIAQLAAVNGIDVWLYDTDSEALIKAQNSISNIIQRLLSKGQLSQEKSADAVRRLRCSS